MILGLPPHLQWQLNFANFCSKNNSFNNSGSDDGISGGTSLQQQFYNNQRQKQMMQMDNSALQMPLVQQSPQRMQPQPQTSFSTEQLNYFVQNMQRQQSQNSNPIFGMTQMVNNTNPLGQQQQPPAFIPQMSTSQMQQQAQPQPLRVKNKQTYALDYLFERSLEEVLNFF